MLEVIILLREICTFWKCASSPATVVVIVASFYYYLLPFHFFRRSASIQRITRLFTCSITGFVGHCSTTGLFQLPATYCPSSALFNQRKMHCNSPALFAHLSPNSPYSKCNALHIISQTIRDIPHPLIPPFYFFEGLSYYFIGRCTGGKIYMNYSLLRKNLPTTVR